MRNSYHGVHAVAYKEYLDMLPEDIVDAIEVLDRRKIALLVALQDRGRMNFELVKDFLNKSPSNVVKQIDELENAGLIVNRIEKVKGRREYSFYEATGFAEIILGAIENALIALNTELTEAPQVVVVKRMSLESVPLYHDARRQLKTRGVGMPCRPISAA